MRSNPDRAASLAAECQMKLPDNQRKDLNEDICVHIFSTSAAMLGVCMTVVGVLHVVVVMRNVNTIADDLLSVDAMIYLLACLSAYWALRTRRKGRNRILERVADGLFLFGLVLSAVATGIITWAIARI